MLRNMLFLLLVVFPAWCEGLEDVQAFTVKESAVGVNVPIFGLLWNNSKDDITLVGASTPVAAQVVLQMFMHMPNGKIQIDTLTELVVPAGKKQWFVPETTELRLLGVKEKLVEGQELPLLLKLSDGTVKTLRVAVVE